MQSRLSKLLTLITLMFLVGMPALVHAQGASLEWARWDAVITVRSDQLQIAETQEINVTDGTIRKGARFWTTNVTVQSVYIVSGGGSTPQQLTQNSSGQTSTYKFDSSSNTLAYVLPAPVNSGDTFVVQINYTATSPTSGMVDWKIIPGEHDFPVLSSTTRIRFPSGQAPDQSLIRIASGSGTVEVNGSNVTIKSNRPIAASQSFAIQVPFGSNVGAANPNNNANNGSANNDNNSGNNSNGSGSTNPNAGNPIAPQIPSAGDLQLPGMSTLLTIACVLVCVVGVFLMFGGGKLLRGILGGLGNTGSGGNAGRGNSGLGRSIIGMIINLILGRIMGRSGGSSFGGGNIGSGNTGNQNDPLGGLFGGNTGNDPNNPLGGLFGGSNQESPPPSPIQPQQGASGGRGFRSSDDQDRNIGNVGNDKDSGGGASFS
jgi:hypothetical protein